MLDANEIRLPCEHDARPPDAEALVERGLRATAGSTLGEELLALRTGLIASNMHTSLVGAVTVDTPGSERAHLRQLIEEL